MGSRSVTCHPTQVNAPRQLTPARQAGTRFTYPGGMEGWVHLSSLIAAPPGIKPTTAWSQVRHPNRYATKHCSSWRTDQSPLFAFLEAIHLRVHDSRRDVQLITVVLPSFVDEVAALVVEWKPRDIDRAVRHGLFVHRPPDTRSVV